MTKCHVFGPKYRGVVEIVGLNIWFLLEIIERQLNENTKGKWRKKKEGRKVHILANICFALWLKTVTI